MMSVLPERAVPEVQSDESLMGLVAAGRQDAFALLVDRHRQRVMRLAFGVLRDRAAAEDVVQETFLRVWSKAGSWNHRGTARFSGWIARVAVNLAIDRARRGREGALEEAPEVADAAVGSEDRHFAGQIATRIARAMSDLPDRQRAAFSLCQLEGLTNAEAAAALNVTIGALELLLVRARKAMRRALADLVE